MTSKIDVFSDSIKIALSDLQNKEHENSQLKVLKKNVKLLKNEIKSKGTIIESLLETQKTLTKYLPKKIPKPFQSIENYNQQQLRQQYSQSQAQQHLQQYQESKIAAQKTKQSSPFWRNNPSQQNKLDTLYIGNLSDVTTVSDLYELFGLSSNQYLSENSGIQNAAAWKCRKTKRFCLHNSARKCSLGTPKITWY